MKSFEGFNTFINSKDIFNKLNPLEIDHMKNAYQQAQENRKKQIEKMLNPDKEDDDENEIQS